MPFKSVITLSPVTTTMQVYRHIQNTSSTRRFQVALLFLNNSLFRERAHEFPFEECVQRDVMISNKQG